LPQPTWKNFRGAGGGDVVRKEIDTCFKHDKRGRAQLVDLMKRVQEGKTLGREVEYLGEGLHEAKLTYRGQEFRLFFSKQEDGLLLLALHLVNKKARRVPEAIKLARDRLSDWMRQCG
jgi:phage-related protein